MNGSRPETPRSNDRPSLDALNRTIEGLEARIEGLMGKSAQRERPAHAGAATTPLSEIIERQRMLAGARDRGQQQAERVAPAYDEPHPARQAARVPMPATDPSRHYAAQENMDNDLRAIKNELKDDISARIGSGLAAIQSEISDLGHVARQSSQPDWLRQDIARITAMLEETTHRDGRPDTDALLSEVQQLRHQIGQPAGQESLDRLESRWNGVEAAMGKFDPQAMQDEIVSLAWRLEEMKSSLGELNTSPAIHALEDKLILLATAVENLSRIQPDDRKIVEQFVALDTRLDEISRAIAASARTQPAVDPQVLQRLEDRIGALSGQISELAAPDDDGELGARMDRLAVRLEEIATQEAALRLDDRLTQIAAAVERHSDQAGASDINRYLGELMSKVEELGDANVTGQLIERMEQLSRRIEEFDLQPRAQASGSAQDDDMLARLESRLGDIVARLDDTAAAPSGDPMALKGLENQIAKLSALINQPQAQSSADLPAGFESRMTAIEDFLSSNDEYILEAARQAAETVVEAYSRQGVQQGGQSADIAVLSGLAEDLRALEEFSRSSEERTYRTFEALHDTLIQIADRLNELDSHITASPAQAERSFEREKPAARTAAHPAYAAQSEREPAAQLMQDALFARHQEDKAADDEAFLQAGIDDLRAIEADQTAPPAAQPPSGGVIANLGRKLMPSRKSKEEKPARTVVEPTPALDSTDLMPVEMANELMEPGSGAPDVRKILERVKAGKTAAAAQPTSDKADIIAAARRAAEAAAADMESDAVQPEAKDKKSGLAKPKLSNSGSNRRPILLAAGAVLLVIMSYPLVSNLIKSRTQPETAAAISAPVENTQATTSGDGSALAIEEPADGVMTMDEEPSDSTVDALASDTMSSDEVSGDAASEPNDTTTMTPAEELSADEPTTDAEAAPTMTTDPAEKSDSGSAALLGPAASTDAVEPMVKADAGNLASGQTRGADGFVAAPVAETEKAVDDTKAASAATDAIEAPAGLAPASLSQAAKSGDPLALFEIGARYTEGRGGLAMDLGQAAKWYGLAADRGFAPAQYRLANFLEKGTGIERDIAQAKRLYLSAAEKGNASAMHNLAVLFATGSDGTPDFAQAAKWFEAAAALGVADSQFNLAILYARGNGVAQDLEQSYKWFAIAALAGDKDAAQKRDEVANAMKPEQLQAAKAATALWKAQPLDPDANSVTVPDEWIGKGKTTASVDMKKAIRNIQAILNNNGFASGTPDGELGAKTISAIKAFQKSVGQEPTGRIDDALVRELLARNKKA